MILQSMRAVKLSVSVLINIQKLTLRFTLLVKNLLIQTGRVEIESRNLKYGVKQ